MPVLKNRRRFLTTLSSAAAASLFGGSHALAEETRLETTRIRLYDWSGVCIAPQFVAEELLKAEGFTDVQYLRTESSGSLPNPLLASGEIDINTQFSAPSIIRVEAGDPVVFLSCLGPSKFEPFATSRESGSRLPRWDRRLTSSSRASRPMWGSTQAVTSTS
jgi:NitT/TauT family transport system substrate-binding protein